MIGHSLEHFLHPSDIENVSQIINRTLRDEILQGQKRSNELNFVCRLKEKNQSRTEVTYRQMRVTGHITTDFTLDTANQLDSIKSDFISSDPNCSKNSDKNYQSNINKSNVQTSLFQDDNEFYRSGSSLSSSNSQRLANVANDIIFLGHVEEMRSNPETHLKLTDVGFDEYVSRHSLDGTLLHADHRISSILGFLPKEVAGNSAYDYIIPEDYSIALFAHKLSKFFARNFNDFCFIFFFPSLVVLSSVNGTGIVVHRLKGVDNSIVFLQTMGCLKFNENGLIDHFACVSRMLKESDGEREIEYFVNRFTPHIQNTSAIELYESMQLHINPYSSPSFSDLATAPDAVKPPYMVKPEQKRLLPARFARYARDQHNAMLQQRNQNCNLNSSPQTQIMSTKVEEPNKETILQVSLANVKLDGVDSEQLAIQNQLTLQKSIRNLNEKSELLMVKTQNQAKNSGPRKRALTASQDMELQKKAKNSNPNNTFIRSYISADSSAKKNAKTVQSTQFKSIDSDDNCLHKSKSLSGVESLPESKYKTAHGQGDYRHMLGAKVFSYNHAENANVLSIYTPQSALDAKQRGRLIMDHHNASGASGTPWDSQVNRPGVFFGPFDNSSPYLNIQNEQSTNLANKDVLFGDAPSSSSQTPTNSRTPDMMTPLNEELESANIGCQLDAMQQANNSINININNPGPSVNIHLHHHHLNKSNSSLNYFNSDNYMYDCAGKFSLLFISIHNLN